MVSPLNLVAIITMAIIIKKFNTYAICGFYGIEEIFVSTGSNFQFYC